MNNHSHLQKRISATENTNTASKWMNKTTVLQTKLTSSLYPARLQDLYVKHDTNTWIAVSCSLIGSLVTLILIGCLLYFQSRSKLRIKHPKRIGRILSSSTGAGRNLDLSEGHFELSTLTSEHQCQDDDTYAEIRLSQIDGACAASCMGTISENEKCKVSKQPNHDKRNTNLYEKCSFETEYDQINLKMKSSFSPLLHKERKVGCDEDHEFDVLSSKKEFVGHGESCTSLTLPPSLKRFRMRENNQPKTHSHSLHHAVSEKEFYNEQERKDIDVNYAEFNQAKYINLSGPNVKRDEDRPYSVVHLSSYNNMNSKERVNPDIGFHSNAKPEEDVLKQELNQAEHIAAPDPSVKEGKDRPYRVVYLSSYNDLNSKESGKQGAGFHSNAKPEVLKPEIDEVKIEDRPYSVVHLSSYNNLNSKERVKPGIGFHSNAKPEENVLQPELNQGEYIAASDPKVKEDEDRPYSVVHLSSYKDLNSKESVMPGIGFHSNAKPEENVLKPEFNQTEHTAASDPNVKEGEDRPNSVVYLSSYHDVNSKERVKPGTGFPSNAKPEEKVLKPEIGEVKHMAASDPNEKVDDRTYSVVHLSLYPDVNSKEREELNKIFSGNAKQEEKELSKQEVPE